MRFLITAFVAVLIVACGDSGDSQTAASIGDSAGEVDFCTCVNEPINTNARHKACTDMMNSMTPEESTTKTFACRESLPVPDGGPDLCFCLRTTTRDPETLQACEALIPEDMTPRELSAKMIDCVR